MPIVEVGVGVGGVCVVASYIVYKTEPWKSSFDCRNFLRDGALVGNIWDFYTKVGDLGTGAFGDVWLAQQRVDKGSDHEHAGRLVAIKRVRKPNAAAGLDDEATLSEDALDDFRNEVKLMKSLDHPNICRLFEVTEDSKNLYLVMEHIEGGELFERVVQWGAFTEADAARVVHQLASALTYCHANGVVHRDIKPENIMLVDRWWGLDVNSPTNGAQSILGKDELMVKLIDFGFSCRILRGKRIKAKVGTFLYSAPEALKGDLCDEKLDMWALGCVLFVLLSGCAPFSDRGSIISRRYSFDGSAWALISEEAKMLINGLLTVDPAKRLSAAELHEQPWLVNLGKQERSDKAVALGHLRTLESFHKKGLCQHVCAAVLARQLDESSLHKLHRMFCTIDTDEDGIISWGEFKQSCYEFGYAWSSDSELKELFDAADMDKSGHIDYTEFVAACLDQKVEVQDGACWSAFQVFDLDGDGLIEYSEFCKVLSSASMQETFSKETLDSVWAQMSGGKLDASNTANNETSIDFDHFLAALREVSSVSPSGGQREPDLKAGRADSTAALIAHAERTLSESTLAPRSSDEMSDGAMEDCSLSPKKPGLPILSRSAPPSPVKLGLPIISRRSV